MTVDRSINDIIPVDAALNESMLNCSKQIDNTETGNDENDTEGDETDNDETKDDGEEMTGKEEAKIEDKNCNMEEKIQIRRSERVRKQRYKLNSDDIGDDDNKSDEDYIPEG